jgi:catechol 2,3-dioxygenase-like lactoylglutathione lyase family enzyme
MHGLAVKLDHVRLDVADVDAAEKFYARAIGLRRVVRYDLDGRVILQLAPDGIPAGVELWQEDGLTAAPHPTHHIAFSVSDVPALLGHVRSLGYRVLAEPYRVGAETVAFVADPDGHLIELNDFRGRGVAEAG